MKFPDGLESIAAFVLDHLIRRQLTVGSAVVLGVLVDARAVVVQAFRREGQLARRDPGAIEVLLGDHGDENPVFLFADGDRPVLGDRLVTPYLGASKGSVGGKSGAGPAVINKRADSTAFVMIHRLLGSAPTS